jgi:hypothetical protein
VWGEQRYTDAILAQGKANVTASVKAALGK